MVASGKRRVARTGVWRKGDREQGDAAVRRGGGAEEEGGCWENEMRWNGRVGRGTAAEAGARKIGLKTTRDEKNGKRSLKATEELFGPSWESKVNDEARRSGAERDEAGRDDRRPVAGAEEGRVRAARGPWADGSAGTGRVRVAAAAAKKEEREREAERSPPAQRRDGVDRRQT